MEFSVSDDVLRKYEGQYSESILDWRDLGGLYKAEHIIELCQRQGIKPKKVLEVGAGEGSILRHLNEANFAEEFYAIDISQTGVEFIKRREFSHLKEARTFDGYTIPYEDKSFDLVILSHVLEHVEYERRVLREIKRVGDLHAIEVPLDFGVDVDERWKVYTGYGHINIYNPALLRFLLKSEGFEILDEVLDIQGEKVLEYKHFVMEKNESSPEARSAFTSRLEKARQTFENRKGREKEQYAKDFTVLTRDSGNVLKIF